MFRTTLLAAALSRGPFGARAGPRPGFRPVGRRLLRSRRRPAPRPPPRPRSRPRRLRRSARRLAARPLASSRHHRQPLPARLLGCRDPPAARRQLHGGRAEPSWQPRLPGRRRAHERDHRPEGDRAALSPELRRRRLELPPPLEWSALVGRGLVPAPASCVIPDESGDPPATWRAGFGCVRDCRQHFCGASRFGRICAI